MDALFACTRCRWLRTDDALPCPHCGEGASTLVRTGDAPAAPSGHGDRLLRALYRGDDAEIAAALAELTAAEIDPASFLSPAERSRLDQHAALARLDAAITIGEPPAIVAAWARASTLACRVSALHIERADAAYRALAAEADERPGARWLEQRRAQRDAGLALLAEQMASSAEDVGILATADAVRQLGGLLPDAFESWNDATRAVERREARAVWSRAGTPPAIAEAWVFLRAVPPPGGVPVAVAARARRALRTWGRSLFASSSSSSTRGGR